VQIALPDGRTVEATLVDLTEEAGSSLKVFAAEVSGQAYYLSPREIRVLDSDGQVIATEERPASDPVRDGPTDRN
jgi:hypothetical protein